MKKTAQTLLTAAIFATALGSTAPSHFRQPVQAAGSPIVELQTNYAGVYGPPPVQLTTEDPAAETTTYTETTEIIPQPAYGPPRTAFPGDSNMDGKADARDLSFIKRAALQGRDDFRDWYDLADVNRDNVVDEKDVHFFMEEILGNPPEEDPAVTTTAAAVTEAFLITTTEMPATSLYGPPAVFTTATETTTVPETEMIPVPVYGPPSMMT